jgi:hypothetical protein
MVMKLSPNAVRLDNQRVVWKRRLRLTTGVLQKPLFMSDEEVPVAAALAGEIVEREQNVSRSIEQLGPAGEGYRHVRTRRVGRADNRGAVSWQSGRVLAG